MPPVAVLDAGSGRLAPSPVGDDWPVVPPTLLTLHRTSDLDEQTRQIICAVNGRRAGQLLYGETLTFEIAPGPHTLRVHNTLFWKTTTFNAEPGDHVHFTVWNRGWGEGYYLMIVFIGAAPLGVGLARGLPEDVAEAVRGKLKAHVSG